jgi:hypothetical protein
MIRKPISPWDDGFAVGGPDLAASSVMQSCVGYIIMDLAGAKTKHPSTPTEVCRRR